MSSTAIIGFGCAGFSAAKALRENDADCTIDIYTDTAEPPSNPMLTTYYVSGKITQGEMYPLGTLDEIKKKYRLSIITNTPVEGLRPETKTLIFGGREKSYDSIVIATGASAVFPPIKGLSDTGVYKMRTTGDAGALLKALDEREIRRAVVVGAQMVGIKVVELLRRRGISVLLADMADRMFPASAFPSISADISDRLEKAGVELRFGVPVTSVTKDGEQLCVSFGESGSTKADIVCFCSGIKPNIGFLSGSGLDTGIGIKTDLHMRTNFPGIYAAGDCCETKDVLSSGDAYIGLWMNSTLEGTVAGSNIAGVDSEYAGNLIHNITHYMDTDFISIGDIHAEGEHLSWSSRDSKWRFEAVMCSGRIMALNILDNASVSGPCKNILIYQAQHPGKKLSAEKKLLLSQNGLPDALILKLGGEAV